MSQNSKSKRLWECSEPMTHGILTELKSFFWQLLSQYCECFQYVPNWYLRNLCHDFFKVASIKPEVSEFFRCLLISLRLSDSDKNFLTLRMTVVLLFFFLGFFLCSSLTMCLFRLKAELNVLEHSLHRCLSATLTFFSLTKVPKPAADFTFFTWFSLCDVLFSWVFTCESYPYFDVCLVSHLSQFQDFFTLSGFCSCTCFLCLLTFDLTSLS